MQTLLRLSPKSLSYKKSLESLLKKIHPNMLSPQELQSNTKLYQLVLLIGKCQDFLYDLYAPDYKIREKNVKFLLGFNQEKNITIKNVDLASAYKNISFVLDYYIGKKINLRDLPVKKVPSKNEYDDYFELLLVLKERVYSTKATSYVVQKGKNARIGRLIHDAWAFKTYFKNLLVKLV